MFPSSPPIVLSGKEDASSHARLSLIRMVDEDHVCTVFLLPNSTCASRSSSPSRASSSSTRRSPPQSFLSHVSTNALARNVNLEPPSNATRAGQATWRKPSLWLQSRRQGNLHAGTRSAAISTAKCGSAGIGPHTLVFQTLVHAQTKPMSSAHSHNSTNPRPIRELSGKRNAS